MSTKQLSIFCSSLFCLLFSYHSPAQTQSSLTLRDNSTMPDSLNLRDSLTLHDSLTAAIEKQSRVMREQDPNLTSNDSAFTWLDGSPSASLMYLDSQQNLGTTESEISLNLPFKSPFLRQVEQSLTSNIEVLRVNAQKQYALYLSGLIRNIVWEIQVEKIAAATLVKKQSMLSALAAQYKEMAEAHAVPQYVALLVQKEFNEHEIASLQQQQSMTNLQAKYHRLTGLKLLPDRIKEVAPKLKAFNVNAHPDVAALDALYQNSEQALLGASKQTAPWNVRVTGKRVETPGFSENQLGLGIEVPINIGNKLSSIQQIEYLQAHTQYNIARSKLINELAEAQADLRKQYAFLQQKQVLLNASKSNLSALSQAMQDLRDANAPNQEFYLRTLLDTLDAEQAIELNLIQIQRHIALMRQAAGLTL